MSDGFTLKKSAKFFDGVLVLSYFLSFIHTSVNETSKAP
jgi:hypothetical protein